MIAQTTFLWLYTAWTWCINPGEYIYSETKHDYGDDNSQQSKGTFRDDPDELEMLLFAESSLTPVRRLKMLRHLDPISSVLHDLGCQKNRLFRRRFVIL
jgi:hypothetical protein